MLDIEPDGLAVLQTYVQQAGLHTLEFYYFALVRTCIFIYLTPFGVTLVLKQSAVVSQSWGFSVSPQSSSCSPPAPGRSLPRPLFTLQLFQ